MFDIWLKRKEVGLDLPFFLADIICVYPYISLGILNVFNINKFLNTMQKLLSGPN